VGTVKAIHNFGAGDLLEIEPTGGGATVVWPFNETTVPLVDVAGGKIVVEPPVDA
jgi:16S rRNA processing protein RimM